MPINCPLFVSSSPCSSRSCYSSRSSCFPSPSPPPPSSSGLFLLLLCFLSLLFSLTPTTTTQHITTNSTTAAATTLQRNTKVLVVRQGPCSISRTTAAIKAPTHIVAGQEPTSKVHCKLNNIKGWVASMRLALQALACCPSGGRPSIQAHSSISYILQ